MKRFFFLLPALGVIAVAPLFGDVAKKDDTPAEPTTAAVSTISIHDLSGFDAYPKQIQSLVQSALALTRLELGYLYGSHDPVKGGMDCSGTVYHVLEFQGLKDVPRQSDDMCRWVEKKSQLHLTPTATAFDHAEFNDLKPGDLLFWTNTTETKRKLPVTHVMIYLGKLKKTGKRVVFGASDGRSFQGERRSGVSVFDFHLPKAESTARLHGYGPAPGLLPVEVQEKTAIVAAPPPPAEVKPAAPAVTPKPKPPPPATTAPKEEVRKAVAMVKEAEPAPKDTPPPASKPAAKSAPKSNPPPAKTTTSKTNSPSKVTSTKKSAAPPAKTNSPAQIKARVERSLDKAADSIRRFFKR